MSDIIKAIYERKMSDAKDLIDEALFRKLAEALVEAKDSKKKLDPVGKEDGATDSYLANRRKAIGKAMKKEDMQYEGIKMTPTPPIQRKKKTRKANKSGDKVVKTDSRSFNLKKLNNSFDPSDGVDHIEEGAPGHDHEHQSAFDHSETEAKEKSLRKVKMRAKGGSY